MALNAPLRLQPQSKAGTRAQRTDVLVISDDDSLLVELGPLLGDRYRVHAVDTPAGIGHQVDIARWIAIVDGNSDADAPGTVARLEVQHPSCPLIVINARPEEWVRSIDRGAVLAAIGRDEVGLAGLSEALLVGEDRLRAYDIEQLSSTLRNLRFDPLEVRPRRRGFVWIGAAVLLIVLAVSAGWLHHRLASAIRSEANGVTGSLKRGDTVGNHADRGSNVSSAENASDENAAPPAPAASAGTVVAAPPPLRSYIAAQPTGALPRQYPTGLNVSGSVIVEFTLSANGSASHASVVQSDLPRVFDRLAIGAVQHGRYSTAELVNGQPARARIKLHFKPTD